MTKFSISWNNCKSHIEEVLAEKDKKFCKNRIMKVTGRQENVRKQNKMFNKFHVENKNKNLFTNLNKLFFFFAPNNKLLSSL